MSAYPMSASMSPKNMGKKMLTINVGSMLVYFGVLKSFVSGSKYVVNLLLASFVGACLSAFCAVMVACGIAFLSFLKSFFSQ